MVKLSRQGVDFINQSPALLSFLYDIEAMPEQAVTGYSQIKLQVALLAYALGSGYETPKNLLEYEEDEW